MGEKAERAPGDSAATSAGVLALLLGGLALGVLDLRPPQPSATEAPGDFSLAAARRDVAEIAREPHPTGSAAHAAVRAYLVRELRAAGIQLELQRGELDGLALENLIARVPGRGGGGTLLLVAHYDTVDPSPGAGDDGAGVAALLGTLRALSAAPAGRNDVVALFSDGEERGLLGARLFAREQAAFAEVDVVLNFDAIGNGGPAVMFETGPDSGGLVGEWARVAPHPLGNSLASVIYGWMPNDTDFSVFRDAGKRGLNFALCGASSAYHSPGDTPERLEDRALLHVGGTALALTRHLAQLDLAALSGRDGTYFRLPGDVVVRWRGRAPAYLAAAFALFVLALARPRSRRELVGRLAGLGRAIELAALGGAAAWGAGALAVVAGNWPQESYEGTSRGSPLGYASMELLLFGAAVGSLGVALLLVARWRRAGWSAERLRDAAAGGISCWFGIFAFFLAVELHHEGAAYPFVAATLCGGTALALQRRPGGPYVPLGVALSLAPALVILAPFAGLLVQLASQSLDVALRTAAGFAGLGLLFVLPALVEVRWRPRLLGWVCVALGAALLATSGRVV